MQSSTTKGSTTQLIERLALVENKCSAAHSRVDKIETSTSIDLQNIKHDMRALISSLEEQKSDVKKLLAWMNRSLGWAAAFLFVGGTLGTGLALLIEKYIK